MNPGVYVSELHSTGNRLSTPQLLTHDDWRNFPFSWTPDSKAVLFVSDRDGIFHIFKQQIDQTVPDLLVGGNEQVMGPRLAPDNSTVVYVIWPKLGESVTPRRLMRVQLSGGPPEIVLQHVGIGNLQCARLPSTLCLYDTRSATQLSFFRFDPVTGKSEEITQVRIEDQTPYAYNWNNPYANKSDRLAPVSDDQTMAEAATGVSMTMRICQVVAEQARVLTLSPQTNDGV